MDTDERALTPDSILMIRLSAIGDVIMASGLITALRIRYPNARLGWLTEETNADILRHHPHLDQLHLLPRQHWRKMRQAGHYGSFLKEYYAFIRVIRREQYTWVLDLQGLLKSAVWAYWSGSQRRIGLGSREGSSYFMTEIVDRHTNSLLIGKEYRTFATYLGGAEENFAFNVLISDEARSLVARQCIDAKIGRYVVFAPFTTRPQKHWFDGAWVELAREIRRRYGWTIVLLGGPGDEERADALLHLVDNTLSIVNLVGRTQLGEAAAWIQGAELLVGVDTGLTHLGIALCTHTLALFGSTRPYLETGQTNAKVLYTPLPCSPCRRHPTCHGRWDCMKQHTPLSVLKEIASHMDRQNMV